MHNASEYNERRKVMRMTYRELALMSGVPLRTVQDILTGKTRSPRAGAVAALERVLYPLQGEELTEEECQVIELYRAMDGRQRDLALRIIKEIMA